MEDPKEDAYMLQPENADDRGQAHPSAYTAPSHLRLQAEPGHSSNSTQKRGDLTADNLERIPEADQVAPGIRLETSGNDYDMREGQDDEEQRQHAHVARDEAHQGDGDEAVDVHSQHLGREMMLDHHHTRFAARAPSSMDMSGRSSTGAMDHEGSERYNDADMGSDEEKSDEMVHERVGGSGATSENASKGTSVGHFGPRGEAIPGVPPHLDPRQPHFRPPSPSAASVFSVAVQPPASPKAQAATGNVTGGMSSDARLRGEAVDSGDETESFDNGALTPTLSDEFGIDDDVEDRLKMAGDHPDGVSSKAGPSFSLSRMNVDLDDNLAIASSSGPYQVSFSPVVTSHHRGSISSYSGRAPSVAATAGSSRAPSTRGLSPPASTSRAGTTEGSSIEEFESSGTGLGGDAGAETPSVGRSRRSSYSAPSSEQDGGNNLIGAPGVGIGLGGEDINSRARGGTLVPGGQPISSHNVVPAFSTTAASSTYADAGDDEGPSLAPSEAGSDSTRSMTYESSHGHGAPPLGLGPGSTSSERFPPGWQYPISATQTPVVLEPPSSGAATGASDTDMAGGYQSAPNSSSTSMFKSPLATTAPMLPSLLAIKRASRRQGSGPASTAATAGTASPPSSVSVDGDFEDAVSEPQPPILEMPSSSS